MLRSAIMSKLLLPLFLATLIGFINACGAASPHFVVNVDIGGTFTLNVNGVRWLASGDTAFRNGGKLYSTSDASLKLMKHSPSNGTDLFGKWNATSFSYQGGQLPVMTTVKVYDEPDLPVAVFTQTYMGNATQTSTEDKDQVISKFPSFQIAPLMLKLGFLAYGGDMAGYSLEMGTLQPSTFLPTGIKGGPIILFDDSTNALVISPLSQFMAASYNVDFLRQITWGIMGLVDNVPMNYSMDFIVYYSNKGINDAMQGWGNYLKKLYNKADPSIRDNDPTIKYLGYWTDNGAYYYYNTEKGQNYEQTVLDTYTYINNQSLPFRYLQFDSWWYFKGHRDGCRKWSPRPDVFPDGFQTISSKTKLPFGCHNRYWDSDTVYAKYNGGDYNFIEDKTSGFAVPDDPNFWMYLMSTTKGWGQFILYEQDWLDRETDNNAVLLSDLSLGRRWLMDMGKAAAAMKTITIQYCMAYSRHILQSLEIANVTQARVSGDYHPGGSQWKIGLTSMFADAVQIAPFKDTFWTTTDQPGNPYKGGSEKNTRLNHLIATLSTGPVGPGDGIGYINKTLLMKCCDTSGQILKPCKPATSIDDQIKAAAFQKTTMGPVGEVYTTYSNVSNNIFGIVLAADLTNEYSFTPSAGWTTVQLSASMIYPATDSKPMVPMNFSDTTPLKLDARCTTEAFCLYYTSPVINMGSGNQVVLMGALDKWVPMSHKRFSSINLSSNSLTINLTVQAKEKLMFTYYQVNKKMLQVVTCDNSQGSTPATGAVIDIGGNKCSLSSH